MTDVAVIRDQWNDHSTPATSETVPALFEAAVRATPHAVALVDGERRLTYRELSDRVAQLAHRLRASGLPPEGVVAICMPRSAEMVVAVLASMTAGGAFVPVDPQWPAARRAQVMAESSARIALVGADDEDTGGADTGDAERIVVDLDDARPAPAAPAPGDPGLVGGRLAYAIFTSGSTGTPKGAMIRHEAICERLMWQRDTVLGFGSDDASLFKAPLAFDISVNEILLPLVSGGRVVVAEPGSEKDPDYLLRVIATEGVTFLYLVSSMLDALLALDAARPAGTASALAGVRHVWCGGEVLTPDLFRRFREQLTTTLYHGYGPAEATIGVSHVIYRDSAERIATSIGRPNPHTQLYVLDENLDPVPIGEGGELYAAGFLLGRGYIGRSALSASAFVANPFGADGSRMYRTGDLARWTGDGTLEFLGRADNQVKIRGRRVELEEIEVAVSEHPLVRQAAVTLTHSATGAESLTGYVTAVPGATIDTAQLRRWCLDRLPEYMVPPTVIVLERFPVNANGKVDRRALPAPEETRAKEEGRTPPRTPDEQLLCDVFSDALGLAEIGIDDDFYALGGDSIVAVTVTIALRAEGRTVRAKDIVAHRTPRRLAEAMGGGQAPARHDDDTATPLLSLDEADTADLAVAVPELREVLPVTSVQSGIYFHSTGAHGDDPYVVQQIVDLVGPVDPERLRAAAHAVVMRHGALAAGFHLTRSGRVVSAIGAVEPTVLRTETFLGHTAERIDAHVRAIAEEERRRGFDLARPPLMRYALVTVGEDRHRLIHTVHHIVADGWSVALVWDDIMAAYRGDLPDAPAPQHTAFLRWWSRRDPQRETTAWTGYLDGVTEPTLTADHVPVPDAGSGFGRRRRALDPGARAALTAYARSRSVSEGSVMTAAWGLLLGCLTARTDVVFGSTTAGRGEEVDGIDRIVGMLLNTVPTRVRWTHRDTVDDIVQRFVAAETTVLDHPHAPLLDLHAALGVRELFDTLFSIENLRRPKDGGDLRLGPIEYIQAPHYRLTALVTLHESVAVVVTNDRSAVDDATADRLAGLYLRIVELIVAGDDRRAALLPALDTAAAEVSPASPVTTAPLADLLASRFAASADDTAVVQGGSTWTYAELGMRANRLARHLIRAGVGPEVRVALALPRTPDLVLGLAAAVIAGGIVVPLDPRHPAARLSHYLDDAAPHVVLSTRGSAAGLRAAGIALPGDVVLLDDPETVAHLDGLPGGPLAASERPVPLHGEHGAYLIYTSGSTGAPKGVLGTQAALANRLAWAVEHWAVEHWAVEHWAIGHGANPEHADRDIRLAKTSMGFIDGMTETLSALLAGAELVVADEKDVVDADRLAGLVRAHGVTQLTGVPTLLTAVAEAGGPRAAGVRRWISSGETLQSSVVDRIAAVAPGATVVDSYGSSEVAGDVTYAQSAAGAGPTTIGTAVPGSRTYLLDAWLRPVADGAVGELYIGGVQLARGYAAQPALTATRFVPDPFGPSGSRLYRTGDLVRRAPDGGLHYIGRRDFQVQVNGIRIELEEVEAALAAVPGVRTSAAAVHRVDGTTRLVGYVTAEDGHRLDGRAVQDAVSATLPLHVVPVVMVQDSLPLTPTGKVDRAALPAPETVRSVSTREPATAAERTLVAVTADALGLDLVGVDDDFFALGGDSISAMSLARLARGRGIEVSVRDVFLLRTPARLAAAHEPAPGDVPPPEPPAPADAATADAATADAATADAVPDAAPIPITPTVAQHRLRLSGLPLDAFVLTEVVDLPAAPDVECLRAAVADEVGRVDALRQRVSPRHKLLWTTEVLPPAPVEGLTTVTDLSDRSAADAVRAARATAAGRIDITAGRTVHAAAVTSSEGTSLVLAVHGLAADRASVHRLAARIAGNLRGQEAGDSVAEPLPPSIAVIADALAERVSAVEDDPAVGDWIDEVLALPAAPPTPAAPPSASVSHTVALAASPSPRDVEEAFVAAVAACAETPLTIDREEDLRPHAPGTADSALGALTGVYPVLAGDAPESGPGYAPWYELLRHQGRVGRARLRRVPDSGILLTRLHGQPADPEEPEGFEALYGLTARYTVLPDGARLQILGPDTARSLLQEWTTRLTDRSTP